MFNFLRRLFNSPTQVKVQPNVQTPQQIDEEAFQFWLSNFKVGSRWQQFEVYEDGALLKEGQTVQEKYDKEVADKKQSAIDKAKAEREARIVAMQEYHSQWHSQRWGSEVPVSDKKPDWHGDILFDGFKTIEI